MDSFDSTVVDVPQTLSVEDGFRSGVPSQDARCPLEIVCSEELYSAVVGELTETCSATSAEDGVVSSLAVLSCLGTALAAETLGEAGCCGEAGSCGWERNAPSGDWMMERDPQIRNWLLSVVTIVESSLQVTICNVE